MKKSSILFFAYLLTVIFIGYMLLYNTRLSDNKLATIIKYSPKVGEATVISVDGGYKEATKVSFYFYTINEGKILGTSGTFSLINNYSKLNINSIIGKKIPVIYNSKAPKLHYKILLDETDFKTFNMKYPDSLRKYFRN